MYQNLFKEVNIDHNFLRYPDLRDNNFEFLRLTIALDKVNLDFAATVKSKPTGNDSVFIAYSNTINFLSKWLDNSGYLITQWEKMGK